ncbi:hypothetical protein N0V90_000195 [Kalmusia sp. IMI 367209]|nr:hypothetical protein N0V90_000195 [Kalmusia sp. IMI 367209]
MSVSHASPRRILGELSPRALNSPSKRVDPSEGARAHSPLKQMQTLTPQLFGEKENAPKGRKRSIHEVEDAERVDDAKIRVGGTAGNIGLSAAAVRLHTEHYVVDLPVPGSPTERNTPTPEPDPSQDAQGSQSSFSAFINYGACASQNSVQAPPSPPTLVEEEKKSRAELLRTRLGFGIYKVKTNQVGKSETDIIAHWESSFSGPTDATSMAVTSSRDSETYHQIPNPSASPAHRDPQPVFIKANLDPFRPIGNLKLTPAPVLLPTATSSRILHDYQMPSSPPQAISPEQLMSPVKQMASYSTPVHQRPRMETERDEDDDERDGSAQDGLRRMQRFQEGELTSSAVKGNAAKGLMQLMAGKR